MQAPNVDRDEAAEDPRAEWLANLGKAQPEAVRRAFVQATAAGVPKHSLLRAPEIGLVMTRGRVGGRGDRFNFGEVTATRCVVQLESGEVGLSYRMGRDKEAAEMAAILDAMRQSEGWEAAARAALVALADDHQRQAALDARRSGATKVQFFKIGRAHV